MDIVCGIVQLYDRISCTVMSPSRAPPGDAVSRCRDAIDAISSSSGHKNIREKSELMQLLSLPHLQVSTLEKLYNCKGGKIKKDFVVLIGAGYCQIFPAILNEYK